MLQRAADGAVSLAARGAARVGGVGREPGVPAARVGGGGERSARRVRGLPAARRRGMVPAGEPGAFERALRSIVDAATDFARLAPGHPVLVKVAANSGSRLP